MRIFFPFKIIGKEKLSSSDHLIVYSNHISLLDPIFLVIAFGGKRPIYYMAKQELFENKFLGWLIKKFGAFPVNRSDGGMALKSAIEVINDKKAMGIFPEGTRSKTGKLGRAKTGIAYIMSKSGANAQPIAIISKNQKVRIFRKTTMVVCDEIDRSEITYDDSDRSSLRAFSSRLMQPIADVIEKYKK